MSDQNEKIEAVQAWINDLRQNRVTDPVVFNTTEAVLSQILTLIHDATPRSPSEQGLSNTYADLERQIQEQTIALNQATSALNDQITEEVHRWIPPAAEPL